MEETFLLLSEVPAASTAFQGQQGWGRGPLSGDSSPTRVPLRPCPCSGLGGEPAGESGCLDLLAFLPFSPPREGTDAPPLLPGLEEKRRPLSPSPRGPGVQEHEQQVWGHLGKEELLSSSSHLSEQRDPRRARRPRQVLGAHWPVALEMAFGPSSAGPKFPNSAGAAVQRALASEASRPGSVGAPPAPGGRERNLRARERGAGCRARAQEASRAAPVVAVAGREEGNSETGRWRLLLHSAPRQPRLGWQRVSARRSVSINQAAGRLLISWGRKPGSRAGAAGGAGAE